MARRRTLNRKDLRANAEAAERQAEDADELEDELPDEDEEDEADDEEVEADADEEAPKPARKKPAAKPKAAKPRKSRATKTARIKIVWGVFDNSNRRVAAFDYPKRAEADALAAKLTADKKSTHFVQPVKEPIEEKTEEEA
jgi:hypothetical protein